MLLEEQEIVAGQLKAQLIDDLLGLLPIKLGLLFGVRYHVDDVVDQVPELARDTAGAGNQSALSVFPFF